MRKKTKRRPKKQLTREVASGGPLALDPFQEQAIDALLAGRSVLVAAPTGTGKTLIAEKLLEKVIAEGKGAVYTSPIKALSNQKYRDFAQLFGGEKVGLITGDVSINEQGLLLVMTTEIFRNWCFANPYMLDNFTHVIFDEIHYLDDLERGTAWEESIIFAPAHIKILGLSATVPNIDEIAAWISQVRNEPVVVIEERRRAVPLKLHWITPEAAVLKEREAREYIERQLELRRHRFWADEEDVFA